MQITWRGHSGFGIQIAGAALRIDPWLTGHPMFPTDRRAQAIAAATPVILHPGRLARIRLRVNGSLAAAARGMRRQGTGTGLMAV